MATDLSLIEISDEDDSLLSLQHTPIVSNGSAFLSCSPLLPNPRSIPSFDSPAFSSEVIKVEKDTSKPTNSSGEDTKDHNQCKENDSENKSEVPTMNVEPQKLKRKKKGGGFNVRKSLAWDRAFFTEQGVLDPLELSMLSGNMLPLIDEGRESLSNECDGLSVSPGLKALENNLFKELPSFARNQGSRIASKTSSKLNHLAKGKAQPASPQNLKGTKSSTMSKTPPQVKQKILSAHDMNRSAVVRSGCPRPVASSSLKRASNASAVNVTSKERRVSKQLTTKNEPLAVSTTPRSSVTVASHLKRNFSSQTATCQKHVGTKGTSSSKRSSQNCAKSGPAGIPIINKPTTHPGKIIPKVVTELETHSSSVLQLPKVSLPSSSFRGFSDMVVPPAAHQLSADDNTITKNLVSLPHNGGNTQHVQTQIPKPSGLRMPSPSMGFFGQSKLSNSQSEIQKGLQPCKPPQDSIPTVTKAVVNSTQRRPPQPYRKMPTSSSTVPSFTSVATNVASCGIIESESELGELHQKEALQLQVNSDPFNEANNDLQMHDADLKSPDDVKTCEDVEKFSTKNIGLQIYDVKLPPLSDPCEQVGKDDAQRDVNVCTGSRDSSGVGIDLLHCVSPFQPVEVECPSRANNTSAKQQEEGSVCENHRFEPDSHTESMNSKSDKTGLDDLELTQQAELKKHGNSRVDPISEVQGQRHNGTMMDDLRSSESCDKDYLSLIADYVLKVKDCDDVSCSPAHSTEMEHKKDETSGIDYWKGGLHVGEMQMLSPDSSVLVRNCKSITNTSAENSNWMNFNSQCAKSAGQIEILNCCVTLEQVPQNICESASNGGVEHGRWPEACPEIINKFTEHAVEDKRSKLSLNSYCVSPDSHTTSMNNDLCRSGSEVHAKHLSGLDEFELSPQQAELKKHGTSRIDPIFEIQSQRLNETLLEDCQSSKNGDRDYNSNAAEDALEVQECGAVSHPPAHSTEMEHIKHETSPTDCLKRDLHKGEVKILSEESSLLVGNCKRLSETSAADSERMIFNSPSTKLVEQAGILDSCATSEQGCQDICKPASKGGFEHGKYSEACPEINDTFAEQPVHAEQLNELFECDLSSQQAELKKPGTFLLNQINDEPSQRLDGSLMEDSRYPEKGDEGYLSSAEDYIHGAQDVSRVSGSLTFGAKAEPTKDETSETDYLNKGLHVDQVQTPSVAVTFLVKSCKSLTNTPAPAETGQMECFNAENALRASVDNELLATSFRHNTENNPLVSEEEYQSDMICEISTDNIISEKECQNSVDGVGSKIENANADSQINDRQAESATGMNYMGLHGVVDKESGPSKSNIFFSDSQSEASDSPKKLPEDVEDSMPSLTSIKSVCAPTIKLPPNVVPFSDEWLAALEAAGEEVLARKGGAVQNSPPDKSLPEPSPWSPVKRKNQEIGPFDCTKLKIQPPNPL